VLLDAPCSSTGTIRRHPDIPWLKGEADVATLSAVQRRLIARAAELLVKRSGSRRSPSTRPLATW
jgi:16S rRNA (cytosine967-C5)-methyltransferase